MKNFVFIHVYLINDWFKILEEQLEKIVKSKLINVCQIKIFAVKDKNDMSEVLLRNLIKKYKNIEIGSISNNMGCGECVTIKEIKLFVNNILENVNILYIHSKGVTQYNSPREKPVAEWRKMMEYYLIEKWKDCISHLELGYDCCGINYQDHAANIEGERKLIKIINGNFFWATSDYIKKIDNQFKFTTRYCPENWILSVQHKIYVPNNNFVNFDFYNNIVKNYR